MSTSGSLPEVKVGGLEIAVPKGSAFAIETPPMMPKAHFLCAVIAPRGYGKGLITTALIEKMKVIDRLIVVSPSASFRLGHTRCLERKPRKPYLASAQRLQCECLLSPTRTASGSRPPRLQSRSGVDPDDTRWTVRRARKDAFGRVGCTVEESRRGREGSSNPVSIGVSSAEFAGRQLTELPRKRGVTIRGAHLTPQSALARDN